DPNRYKDVIVKKVEGTLDRPFAITGDIGWRFWPRLGLTLNGVELGQAKGFTTDNNNQFAKIGEASVYVAITPLLSKHIEVDKLLIKDAHFYFARHSDGTNNWDDLRHLQKSPKTTETKTTTRTDSFDWMISDLAIQDTEIIWNDAKNKQKIGAQIKELSTALEADHTNPIDAVFDVVIEPGHIQATVQVESDYSFDPGYQRYTAEHGQITMKVTGLDGLKGPQDIDAHFEALRLDLKQDQLQIEKLKANIFDGHLSANLSGDNISKTPHMQGVVSLENINLQKLGQALGKELHITEDKLKTLNAEATFKNTANGFTIDPFAAQLGDTRVNGTLSADKAISNLKFNLNVNHVHFQDAKNTAGKTTKTGAKSKSSKSVMPTRIQKITAVGDIHIDSATIGGMNLQNIDMHINAKNGTVNLAPLKAHLYSGELSTTTAIHLQNPIPYFDIDAKLSHINVGSFLKDRGSKSKFQGHLNLQTKLKTQGLDRDRIVNSLNGTAKFNIDDGVLHGI
ncbi:MAG TPA: AsmA family protein, partial [Gammaproteobacteria bacterium]|nr:AsmA family protein [Gammaproteobacteria bacterium]